jgi:Arc/MetJ-type ribon-helix-helix transcriptional regulator
VSAREDPKGRTVAVLREVARAAGLITYRELVDRIGAYNPQSPSLHQLLGEISRAEHQAGRGLLSAVVVAKHTGRPGEGFFEFAQQLGLPVSDRTAFWREELRRVYDAYRSEARSALAERAISVRLDRDADRALEVLVASGMSRSEAIRQALVDAAERTRRASLAEEARSVAEDQDDRAAIAEIATFMDALSAEG